MSEEIFFECTKCCGILTPWGDNQHVCDVCGYGKHDQEEFDLLQESKEEVNSKTVEGEQN